LNFEPSKEVIGSGCGRCFALKWGSLLAYLQSSMHGSPFFFMINGVEVDLLSGKKSFKKVHQQGIGFSTL
jgi:hypothetical protein